MKDKKCDAKNESIHLPVPMGDVMYLYEYYGSLLLLCLVRRLYEYTMKLDSSTIGRNH